jgi:hypothetical protein
MSTEAKLQNIPPEGFAGGLIIDKMDVSFEDISSKSRYSEHHLLQYFPSIKWLTVFPLIQSYFSLFQSFSV